jgi:Flp pilus assembly protein TadB
MTLLFFLLAVVLFGVAARLVTRALFIPRMQLRSHLREISDYGFQNPIEDADIPLSAQVRRAVTNSARRTGRFLRVNMPTLKPLSTSELNAAGYYEVEVDVVHGYRAFAALGLPLFFAVLLFGVAHNFGFLSIVLVLIMLLGGWMGPSAYIRRRGNTRLEEIDRRLPELIDLLIATVEAGMGFTASLQLVAERFDGPLGEELRLTMQQQSLGMSIQGALDEMVLRCDTPSVRAFTRTAARGESLGVSIGPVLRELSADQRRRHRMAAREKMQKAPVKMIFPLVFLVMPALMIVIFYPALYGIKHSGAF